MTFVPPKGKTPALRAGIIDASNPYQFDLPTTWAETRVPNTQSGNYCQPRCDEPWTEVIFENGVDGKVELIVAPLRKFTPSLTAKVEDFGNKDEFLPRVGPYLTGDYYEPEYKVSSDAVSKDGLTYYVYELFAPDSLSGPHILGVTTFKDEGCLLLKISATEKQWKSSKAKLVEIAKSFKA